MSIALKTPPTGGVGLESPPARRRWTMEEYYQLADAGFFHDQRVELVDGDILMSPMGIPHRNALYVMNRVIEELYGDGFIVFQQVPFRISDATEVEPDVVVLRGTLAQVRDAPITTAELVVEIADTSLGYDLGLKSKHYAMARVPEYWVLDLKGRQLIVHRDPGLDASGADGFGYKSVWILDEKQTIAPLGAPSGKVAVADLLP
jgi:hypothetical protein